MAHVRAADPKFLFGQAVKQLRLQQSLSQERLAELAGIHRNYAGEVERGERNVALLNMVRIAHALGVPLSKLVEGIDGLPEAIDADETGSQSSKSKRHKRRPKIE